MEFKSLKRYGLTFRNSLRYEIIVRVFACVFALFASGPVLATEVALTFDDLPEHAPFSDASSPTIAVGKIIATLKKHKIKDAYGFVIGGQVKGNKKNQQILKDWVSAGFLLGNHSYSHEPFQDALVKQYISDIVKNEKVLELYSPKPQSNWQFYRYPHLRQGEGVEARSQVHEFLRQNKYKIAPVTLDFADWKFRLAYENCQKAKDPKALKYLEQRYILAALEELDNMVGLSKKLFNREIKFVMLLHAGEITSLMLDELFKKYSEKGVKIISLAEATKDELYDWNSEFTKLGGRLGDLATAKSLALIKNSKKLEDAEVESLCPIKQ